MTNKMFKNVQKVHCSTFIVHCPLLTVDCGLWTVDCGLFTADCSLFYIFGLGFRIWNFELGI